MKAVSGSAYIAIFLAYSAGAMGTSDPYIAQIAPKNKFHFRGSKGLSNADHHIRTNSVLVRKVRLTNWAGTQRARRYSGARGYHINCVQMK